MRIRTRAVGTFVSGSVLLVFALTLAGCSRPRSWRWPWWGDRAGAKAPAFSGEDAVILARLEAKSKGVQIDEYDISARQKKQTWWVGFQRSSPPEDRKAATAWPNRFAVKVSPAGEVDLVRRM